jgi:hypothetical protein
LDPSDLRAGYPVFIELFIGFRIRRDRRIHHRLSILTGNCCQFTIRALLVLTLAVACFFGGMTWQRELMRRHMEHERAEKAAQLRTRLSEARMTLQH